MTLSSKRFGRESRLRKRSEFQHCQSQGKRYYSRQFVVTFTPRPVQGARLGIVVTRQSGNAVNRNRWKRMIRDLFRLHRDELLASGDHVVMVRRDVRSRPDPESRRELLSLFTRMGRA